MEFNERKTDPPSTRELLYNQVKEQSDLCDMTIKHGFWEKRFHWCVLVASPYFENIRRNNFIEKELGAVSMTVGTPVSLEEAVLFLYGKKPKLCHQNIAALIEVAEYLIIPELKAHCVKWIKSKSTDAENCMSMLRLASLYNFDLPTLEESLKGCLPELMVTDEMMDLTYESVEYLFTDPSLTYVNVQEKFSFLVRWTNHRPDRKLMFGDLLQHIDFKDLDKKYRESVVLHEPLIQELENAEDFINSLKQIDSCVYCDILLFPEQLDYNKISCFDLTRKSWCSIKVDICNKPENFQMSNIRRSRCQKDVKCPHIYVHKEDYYSHTGMESVFSLNLEINEVDEYKVEVGESNIRAALTYLLEDKVFFVSQELIKTPYAEQGGIDLHKIRLLASMGIEVDPFLLHAAIQDQVRKERFYCSVLHTGLLQSESPLVQPMICIRDKISKLCANNTFVAMLSENAQHMYLYNTIEYSFDVLNLEFDTNRQNFFKLASVGNDGFVLYDNKSFVTILRQFGPNLHQKFKVDEYRFCIGEIGKYRVNEYFLSDNKWYHHSQSTDGETMFSMTTHNKLVLSIQARDSGSDTGQIGVWEPLPTYGYKGHYFSLGSNVLQIRLSKERLSCAKDCPHCKVQEQSQRRVYNQDDDDDDGDLYNEYYRDEDDYYGYGASSFNFYGYDSDEYYYYSSD